MRRRNEKTSLKSTEGREVEDRAAALGAQAAQGSGDDEATQDSGSGEITELLVAWSGGDAAAGEELLRRILQRLQGLAASFLRKERNDHTLQTMALVNEAYLRMVRQEEVTWRHRDHFFAITGRMMRRILVDHARRRSFGKHGGQMERLPAEALEELSMESRHEDLLALDEALNRLAEEIPELAVVVELRYFVGLTGEEIAEALGISTATVQRRWRMARAWLHRFIKEDKSQLEEENTP